MESHDDLIWYYWEGGLLTLGTGNLVLEAHSHYFITLIATAEGRVLFSHDGGPAQSHVAVVIRENEVHDFHMNGARTAVIFIDPNSRTGRRLVRLYPDAVTELRDPPADLPHIVDDLLSDPYQLEKVSHLAGQMAHKFCRSILSPRVLDPRVVKALELIKALDHRSESLRAMADEVHLSPSRFAHLFAEDIGLSFGRYVLWRRVFASWRQVLNGASLSTAAHAAGFTDAAHFSRTFHKMFGVAPSMWLREGKLFEIQDPILRLEVMYSESSA